MLELELLELELVEQIPHKSQATPKQIPTQISSNSQANLYLMLELELLELELVEQLPNTSQANPQANLKQLTSKSLVHA